MKRFALTATTVALLGALSAAGEEPMKIPAAADHGMIAPAEIEWVAGPASLPSGARMAVLEGDPSKEGIFTMRLSVPAGFKISPHWHAAFEHVTVISGGFGLGAGDTFDKSKGRVLPAGGFAYMAPGMRHFAWTDSETVLQLHGMGPWQIYYVNPADDPRQTKKN